MRSFHGLTPVFNESNLVSAAGLAPLLALAESAGLSQAVADTVTVPSVNPVVKTYSAVAGMAVGADSIDDLDVLRAGANSRLLHGVRAPSTMGTWLRSFTHGHVQQLAVVNRIVLRALAKIVPNLVSGDELVFVDIDDTVKQMHGYHQDGVGYGYTKVKGLNALITTISTPHSAPIITEASLRRGSTRSGKGAARHIARTLTQTRDLTSANAQVWVRGDAAFATWKNVNACLRAGAWFSFTIPVWANVERAINTIPEDAWTAIKYPNAIWDEETGKFISDAEVAEIPFTAFTSHPGGGIDCRLIVRRVKRLNPAGQGELFGAWRHHVFITNNKLDLVQADSYHRGHAIIEQVIAELKGGSLTHLPSGKFNANAAWLQLAVITFNLLRAVAVAAALGTARAATITRKLINIPARLASSGRQTTMRMPINWPWAQNWQLTRE